MYQRNWSCSKRKLKTTKYPKQYHDFISAAIFIDLFIKGIERAGSKPSRTGRISAPELNNTDIF